MFKGKWQAVSGKLGTATIPLPATVLTIAGEGYAVQSPEGEDSGDIVWGAGKDERTMDMIGTEGPHKGSRIEALARVRGKFLQLCYAVDGSRRPTTFETTPGTAVVTVRYRRIESGDAIDYASRLAEAEAAAEAEAKAAAQDS
ncbi:MAG: hypothetical protein SynsKO_19810 [Synoicihabitans sp.]